MSSMCSCWRRNSLRSASWSSSSNPAICMSGVNIEPAPGWGLLWAAYFTAGRLSHGEERLEHRIPAQSDVPAVIPPSAHGDDPPLGELVGDGAEPGRRMRMGGGAVAHMGDGVALDAVRPALEQDEL